MNEEIKELIDESVETHRLVYEFRDEIEKAGRIIVSALRRGNKVMACGNGGSALQAQHFIGELVGKFEKDKKALAGIALNVDSGVISAVGNDTSFDLIFRRQVEALGKKGDVLICFSTSGNSKNLIEVVNDIKGITVINLLGRDGGKMKESGDLEIIIPSKSTARIQECHLLILHILAKLVENAVLK